MKFRIFFIGVFIICVSHAAASQENAFKYDDRGARDPMWPLVTSGGAVVNYGSDFIISDLVLEGIMFGENNTGLAIINGKIVNANEKIGDYLVSEVHRDKVVLTKGDQKFELKLKKEE